jgi:ABC-type transport system involved in multi-copper enzyme maturation permease subunit
MPTTFVQLLFPGFLLAIVQGVAALPWLYGLTGKSFRRYIKDPTILGYTAAALGAMTLLFTWLISENRSEASLLKWGRGYGSLLHVQLAIDFLVLFPQLILIIWPKGGAVALAAFRECWRQPMFWLISGLVGAFLPILMVVPYFTFGEDYKMMKQLDFDLTMLASALFGLLAASISINEEIEGRTAVTVMSKPISRRQFILGKYFGTLLGCWAMMLILGWNFTWCLYIKPYFDPLDDIRDTMPTEVVKMLTPHLESAVKTQEGAAFARGISQWFGETIAHHVGLLLTFGQVMVLLSICTALATRMPFIINLVICLFVFLIGHLAPVLVKVTASLAQDGGPALKLVHFISQLFNTIFPALEYFDVGGAIVRSSDLPILDFSIYVGSVFLYSVLYSAIGLFLALILFEDRDLA